MKIGLIGTGEIGGTIAKKLTAAGHNVKVNNSSSPEELNKKAAELGVIPATLKEVVKDVEVIIFSVPTTVFPTLPKDLLSEVSKDVIIVDTSNYYPFRDGDIEDLNNGKVESIWVSEHLGRPVIKAFNNLLAHTLAVGGVNSADEERIAMAISGDDTSAKKIVSSLVKDAGFDPVDAGKLSDSWRHQPGTPAYCTELNAAELEKALDDGIKENAGALRNNAIAKLIQRTTPPSHEEVVNFNRSMFPENPKTT
ncbi:NADPH-dependent F420 reductase [Chitinophaga sancti]|uniref:NADPH-dependent F420 reductase n=1 Tax=Chitinophaga sancti TaxID=1004 RepID=UPI003F78BA09